MPLYHSSEVSPGVYLGIWKIAEEPVFFLDKLSLSEVEQQQYDTFIHNKRRLHWLSYRLLLQELLGKSSVNILYSPTGKPMLANVEGNISVSHSGDFAAILYSQHRQTGIDIEIITDRILRLSEKFVSEDEEARLSEQYLKEELYILWGAKESLYKLKGKDGVDFKENLHIFPFQFQQKGEIDGIIQFEGKTENYTLHYEVIEGYILVYTSR
ncbi:MAG: 4'-phosphopantetheinyl transferase superfamily protein [Bacteroidota bacterium]